VATTPGTFEIVATELSKALGPMAERLRDTRAIALLAELGLELPQSALSPALQTAFRDAVTNAEALPQATEDLVTAIDGGDTMDIVGKGVTLMGRVLVMSVAVKTIADEISATGPIPGLTPADLLAFVEQLPKRLVETMIVEYLENEHALILAILELFGLAEQIHANVGSTDPLHPDHVKKMLRLDRLETLIKSPDTLLKDLYKWGLADFDGALLIERVTKLLDALDLVVTRKELPGAPPRPAMEVGLVTIAPTEPPPAPNAPPVPGLDAVLMLAVSEGVKFELPITEGLAVQLAASGAMEASVGVRVLPPADISLIPPQGTVQGQVSAGLALSPKAPAERLLLLGIVGGTGLSVKKIGFGVLSGFRWSSTTNKAEGDFGIEGRLEGGQLRVGMDGADGFLGKLLSSVKLEADFELGFGWTAGGGIYFTGSGVLEILLPAHISLGPINIDGLTLTVGLRGGKFPVGLAANISALLGPLAAAVEQVGAEILLSFPADHSGNAGPLQVDFGFKPPKGVGLAVDAGAVKGGGYLYFDFEKEEYAGALELVLAGFLTLKAIGLVTTKMPDGSKGFSLLIIITVEFGTGIQLGMGFTLVGVGGLLGLNRTVRLMPLAEGVRTGAVNNIMFPKDVVANAPRIISDLRIIFPPYEGKFLIGPMAKLGWGSPPLITLSLGVIIEIPGNLAILGVLRCILPDEKAPVLKLQVAFVGAIEFDKKRLWLFAGIFDSKILTFTIEGEMGVLFAWGDPDFVLSVGGFHPRFTAPPLPFPSPKRLAITILNEDQARVKVSCYFAVTTNTVQFGAAAELFFGFSAISVEGGFHFDALFQFSPFYFIIELGLSASLKVFGMGVFSISVELALEGPTPWHARGRGSISFFFFDVSANFDETWGEEKDTTLPPIEVFPVLAGELAKDPNWTALPPKNANLLVSLRAHGETKEFVLHPVGTLRVTQRAVPLNSHIDLFGNQKPSDADRFTLAVTTAGLSVAAAVKEEFAPAQFHTMSRNEKLAAPAFASEDGGVDISATGDQLRSSLVVRRIVRYEQIIIDTAFKRFQRRFTKFAGSLFAHFLGGNAAARSALSARLKNQMQPFKDVITTDTEGFAVADTSNNRMAAGTTMFGSYHAAKQHMEDAVAQDPALAGTLHVLNGFEVNKAA
jgi:uncharacterized protein DUF6603